MRELVQVMKALSDPGRVKVLKMLEAREMCACEIIGLLGLAQPTVSRHLKVLVDAGLIRGRKVGSWVHYRLAEHAASPCARAMLAALPAWLEDDPEIMAMRRAMRQDLRQGLHRESPQDPDVALSPRPAKVPGCCGPAATNP